MAFLVYQMEKGHHQHLIADIRRQRATVEAAHAQLKLLETQLAAHVLNKRLYRLYHKYPLLLNIGFLAYNKMQIEFTNGVQLVYIQHVNNVLLAIDDDNVWEWLDIFSIRDVRYIYPGDVRVTYALRNWRSFEDELNHLFPISIEEECESLTR